MTRSHPLHKLMMWCLIGLILSVGSGGGLNCTCQQPPGTEPTSGSEPSAETRLDANEPEVEEKFECKDLINEPCTTDGDCEPPQPTFTKPPCPNVYCGPNASHGRNIPYDPTRPGRGNWDPSFYPPTDSCECRFSCPSYVCLDGTCQIPPPEPPPEQPPIPDLPPQCPDPCQSDSDCKPSLCSDRTKCINSRCINPLVKP